MKRFDTLMTRTVLLISGVVIAVSLCFLLLQRLTIGLPLVDASAEYLAARVRDIAPTAATISADPARLPQSNGLTIMLSFNAPADAHYFAPLRTLYRRELEAALRERLGPQLEYRESSAGDVVWLRSPETGGRWFGIPNRLRNDDVRELLTWMLLSSAVLIALAAFAFARRVTLPLTELARGAMRLPEVALDPALSQRGPLEIRHLAAVLSAQSQALELRDRERALMLAAISHDLRTPLARMRLAIEMAELPEEHGRREIERNVDEINEIVDQFIGYARGAGDEQSELMTLDELVLEVMRAEQLHGMPIEPRLDAPASLALKPLSLRRALVNLIENARRHGVPPFSIVTEQDAQQVRVLVRDSGTGIAADQLARALQPFVRLEAAAGKSGTGLGLAIVQRVAAAHGGRILIRHEPAAFAIGLELPR